MAGDVPVWPDNMALMTVKGGCLQRKFIFGNNGVEITYDALIKYQAMTHFLILYTFFIALQIYSLTVSFL